MILIKNCAILPMTSPQDYIEKGYIVINDDRIYDLGEGDAPEGAFQQVIDGQDMVALPGLVNAHTHAAMTLMRGYADDLPLMEWLQEKIWPFEDRMDRDDIYWGTKLGIVEMIKSGTTCFADMYFHMDMVARAVEETGIRASLARGMIGVGPESELAFNQSRELVEQWNGKAQGRISIRLGPHAPYTCPPDYLTRVIQEADRLGVGIHIHLAETLTEVNDIKAQYGMTPIELMEKTGLFSASVLAAHCVHLSENDMEILARRGVGVAHNPESNMKLASGIAPVPALLKLGVAVGLGTDGAASNNNLDLIEEMRTCALLHKVAAMDSKVVPAYQVLEMATVNGAKALGMNDIGTLEKGKKADIIMVDLAKPHLCPLNNVVAHLVYSVRGSDVDTVIINGSIVMRNRSLTGIDEGEIMQKVRERMVRLTGNPA